jgi:hypothetical protein
VWERREGRVGGGWERGKMGKILRKRENEVTKRFSEKDRFFETSVENRKTRAREREKTKVF